MDRSTTANITINGDLSADNLKDVTFSNDFEDLTDRPITFDGGEFAIKSFSQSFTIGTKYPEDCSEYTRSSASYDRAIYTSCEWSGYYAIGIMGWLLTGDDADYMTVYCSSLCRKGSKLQCELIAPSDSVQAQIANMSKTSHTCTFNWWVLYRKVV